MDVADRLQLLPGAPSTKQGSMWWYYLSIHKLQRLRRTSLEMDE